VSKVSQNCRDFYAGTNFEMFCKRYSWLALLFALFIVAGVLSQPEVPPAMGLIPFLVWITWFVVESRFRRRPESIRRAIGILDVGLLSLFVLLATLYSLLLMEPGFRWIPQRLGWVLATAAGVSFGYGLYYGGDRWGAATARLALTLEGRASRVISFSEAISEYFARPDRGKDIRGSVWIFGVTSVLTLVLSRGGWSDYLVPLGAVLIVSIFPVLLGSMLMRRIHWWRRLGLEEVLIGADEIGR
jgi:hypothetical protein